MPIQTISLYKGRTPAEKRLIADCIQDALSFAGYPSNDRFQKIHEYEDDDFIVDPVFPNFSATPRTRDFVLVQIWISTGRPDSMKHDMIEQIQHNLGTRVGLNAADVMVVLQETARENSSLYRGVPPELLPRIVPRAGNAQ
ncbi:MULTISPECIES: tautomerase family protein [unclassified Paraburkholderia]|jgi:phenylpyruvate tautomerase PptA (4-oxalocrotonate tautomerase family)|uniref:tautomerase family protein n=1 Tax=unclassified Paraburkholderia TaxID=2615204 RepID=UPI0010459590|nr:tautomerase family protein [Paraburkholderia sp. BL9I2N2]TCK95783.1 tautomerase-like protein [Paraburkholderia sp. BL9I2N2]